MVDGQTLHSRTAIFLDRLILPGVYLINICLCHSGNNALLRLPMDTIDPAAFPYTDHASISDDTDTLTLDYAGDGQRQHDGEPTQRILRRGQPRGARSRRAIFTSCATTAQDSTCVTRASCLGSSSGCTAQRTTTALASALVLVQRVIHRHGGRVWAGTAVVRGATIYCTLQGGIEP